MGEPASHAYLSTACFHGIHGQPCRKTCKYCNEGCGCPCHLGDAPPSVSWVDQARAIARELFAVTPVRNLPTDLLFRIQDDPDLFWLRGEEQPPGTWEAI